VNKWNKIYIILRNKQRHTCPQNKTSATLAMLYYKAVFYNIYTLTYNCLMTHTSSSWGQTTYIITYTFLLPVSSK